MKILHTSDWHIGKRIGEYSLADEQQHVLQGILRVAREEHPDAILIAGDIYDRSIPSAEAVTLLDDTLSEFAELNTDIFLIAGNHDSAERLAYASRLLARQRIHISPVYSGEIASVVLHAGQPDETEFWMLPYIKPSLVRHYADEASDIRTGTDAVRHIVDHLSLDSHRRHVLLMHQYITDAERTDSEDCNIGGLDNVDAEAVSRFDYVALGHLHRAQDCGKPTIRYSGTPMKYSFSEVEDTKSVTLIEWATDGAPIIRERSLTPLHDWYDLRGTYDSLTALSFYRDTPYPEAFVRITLTDEQDIPNGQRKLKAIYHRLVELRYDNARTRSGMSTVGRAIEIRRKRPIDLMNELYTRQNACPMSEEQQEYMNTLIDCVFHA